MQERVNIGKILEEARATRGISLAQASEDLKIRSDYLLDLEQNTQKHDLPEVYRIGFLRLYVRYLKLDIEALVEAYKRQSASKPVHEKPVPKLVESSPKANNSLGQINADGGYVSMDTHSKERAKPASSKKAQQAFSFAPYLLYLKNPYVRMGGLFCGILGAFAIIAWILFGFLGNKNAYDEYTQTDQANMLALEEGSAAKTQDALTLYAEKNEVHVVVRQEKDKKRLFFGKVHPGKPITLERLGPVKIHFSDGEHFLITKSDGQKIRPQRKGVGWIEI